MNEHKYHYIEYRNVVFFKQSAFTALSRCQTDGKCCYIVQYIIILLQQLQNIKTN